MRRAIAAVLAVTASSGCATTWLVTQATDTARVWDESVHEQSVPMPGVDERLSVSLPLEIEYEVPAGSTTGASTSSAVNPAHPPKPLPFALTCASEQRARDTVYHQAYRYGSGWKKGTALMVLAEGLAATALVLGSNKPENQVFGGFFAIDALGTAVLLFAPRKEIYRHDERPVVTHLRSDCPDGLALDLGGQSIAIDAAGRIGELGETALDEYLAAPTGPARLVFGGQTVDLPLGPAEQCTWARAHHADRFRGCATGYTPRVTGAAFVVPAGTLTQVAGE